MVKFYLTISPLFLLLFFFGCWFFSLERIMTAGSLLDQYDLKRKSIRTESNWVDFQLSVQRWDVSGQFSIRSFHLFTKKKQQQQNLQSIPFCYLFVSNNHSVKTTGHIKVAVFNKKIYFRSIRYSLFAYNHHRSHQWPSLMSKCQCSISSIVFGL